MQRESESPLLRRFLDHLRLVSVALLGLAALCLLGVLMLERAFETNPDAIHRDAMLWLKMLEEIPKGVLAASAVAFLYDWLLKVENADQMYEAVGRAFDAGKLELLDDIKFDLEARGDDVYVDFMKEAVLSPLESDFLPGNQGFYRVSLHCRFHARYFGDKVKFVLLTSEGPTREVRSAAGCIFYWIINFWPRTPVEARWFEVTSLKVNNTPWDAGRPVVGNNAISVEFGKPRGAAGAHTQFVSYEFDVRLIDSTDTINFYVSRQTLRPVFRIDARMLAVKNISSEIIPDSAAASKSSYVAGPEGEGTCQVFVTGRVLPVGTVSFTMKKDPKLTP